MDFIGFTFNGINCVNNKLILCTQRIGLNTEHECYETCF